MLPSQNEGIPAKRECAEDEKRTPVAEAISQPSARISVNGAQQGEQPVKKTDHERAPAEIFEILRCEAEPQPLTNTGEK